MIAVAAVGLLFACSSLLAQDAGQRASELAASLDKTKYKKKEKRNFSFEFYIDIKNVSAERPDATQYSGHYWADQNWLDLRVSANGAAEGSGYDRSMINNKQMSFTLREARISGALLTATKVYCNGEIKPFEGVLVERTVNQGKNVNTIESRQTMFGLGYIENGSRSEAGVSNNWTNRMFLEKR